MELYFKELISEEASLDKLVDDLERVVQGADDLAKSIGVDLAEYPRTEIARRLYQLKESCQRINCEIVGQVQATDRLVRKHPYSFVGVALLLGVFMGARVGGRK
jgi:ElaB/YqjD/DUF883 family membrane-anchored ribosome-binding protein